MLLTLERELCRRRLLRAEEREELQERERAAGEPLPPLRDLQKEKSSKLMFAFVLKCFPDVKI